MNFGEKMTLIRKQKKLSQAELGKRSGINGDIVGKYERNEMKPSIETAKKLADALEISLDYLVGNTDVEIDKNTLDRIQEISKLSEENKEHIFVTIDALIRDFKNKQAYASK